MTQPEPSATDHGKGSRDTALRALAQVRRASGMPVGDIVEAARRVLTEALGKPVTITVGAEKESNN